MKVILGLSLENGTIEYFEGAANGKIADPKGENGFGFDKIFQPEGYQKTFGEMSDEEKNATSMRNIAFEKLKEFVKKL